MSSIAAKLCQYRAASKLTQQAVADQLGIKTNIYGSWEAGHTYPSARYLPELAVIFGVNINELFPDNNENKWNSSTILTKKMDENEAMRLVLRSKEEVIEAKNVIIAKQLAQIEKLQHELSNWRQENVK
ncbi:helix-turn-helix domain-containing protein [Runella sp. SP2]|uniref:helix-turn-helix domain-containing protein n=1 Tax=Runella sp. SP2 TaxID=2268026 RepID=UPI000F078C1D|nr:helix-turn-helix transcriptional regulator [Runella sp. SP2]AYQ34381.1 XRE family transcriptional regulator [Runella sp. SP2]